MQIPLPDMMRVLRSQHWQQQLTTTTTRWGIGLWAALASRPRLYRLLTAMAARTMAWAGSKRGRLSRLPLARGWTEQRDMPAPQGATFQQLWQQRQADKNGSEQ